MRTGVVRRPERGRWGKPLAGVRVRAAEPMQALPYATQLRAYLGAEIGKVQPPGHNDSGRGARPAIAGRIRRHLPLLTAPVEISSRRSCATTPASWVQR